MFGHIWMGILGIFSGLMVSGGVFTALLALGLVPRFAGKTHTADKVLTYESAVVSGCTLGGILSVLPVEAFLREYFYSVAVFQNRFLTERKETAACLFPIVL